MRKTRPKERISRPRSMPRLAFILVSALAGGFAMGRAARPIFDVLFRLVQRLFGAQPEPPTAGVSSIPFVLLGFLVGAAVAIFILSMLERIGRWWDRLDIGDRVTAFVGIFAGLLASLPFLMLFNSLDVPTLYIPLLIVGLTIGFSALATYALQSMEEILPWNRGRGRSRRTGVKLLDTNVIIDGRIYDVVKTGFIEGRLYVPGFVLDELQFIADSHDALRRQRGRRGLEVLRHLQNDFELEVRTYDRFAPDAGDGVDARLVRLAKAIGADIVTNDFNLNKVAALQDVKVLNMNDLALSLRPNVLPQETLILTIVREGNQIGQGVGYLEDGTMVVVANGKSHLGETLEVVVTQVVQTERGKMIFGEPGGEVSEPTPDQGQRRKPPVRRQV
jgi:uncharacterized protein YacL